MSNIATVLVDQTTWHPTGIHMPHGAPKNILTAGLPDWTLLFVEYSGEDELNLIRKALFKAEMKIVHVTESRMYFEEAA